MSKKFSIAVAQINPTVGDVAGNLSLILSARQQAAEQGADLLVCPELCLCGTPLRDLDSHAGFIDRVRQAVKQLAQATADGGPAVLLGTLWARKKQSRNMAVLLDNGVVTAAVSKRKPEPIECRGVSLGVLVGKEDPEGDCDVACGLEDDGAEILINLTAQPFVSGENTLLLEDAQAQVKATGLPLVLVNTVGGQDDRVYGGGSFVLNPDGEVAWSLDHWWSDFAVTRWQRNKQGWVCAVDGGILDLSPEEHLYQALMLGLRDYVGKNGFPGVVLGLSGGIDSALVAALATDALGAERVWGVMLPSPYTSQDSKDDAAAVAKLLGIRFDTLPIDPAMTTINDSLKELFKGHKPDLTEENIQSRCRGILLMALSNKLGPMVLATGNKSEIAAGYATLYGDMCGGYAVLKDVYKTDVFALSRWRNDHCPEGALGPEGAVMPERVITKPPSAELRPNQKDQDSLPPYPELDAILRGLIEENCPAAMLVERGFDAATVERVWQLLRRSEYKRQQGPVGPTVSCAPFGRGFRLPITSGF